MDPDSPTDPVALVTGASRGIGAAVARRLARDGAPVLVAARGLEACEELAGEIQRAGGRAAGLALDVADATSRAAGLERAHELARELVGEPRVDWLVNNAGFARSATIERSITEELDEFEAHLAVNFHGAVRLVHGLLGGWKERGSGRVVNVASSAGLVGYAYVSAYCASKHALVGFTRAAAKELEAAGVRLHAVCPHYVDTPMLQASIDTMRARTGKHEAELRSFVESQNPGGRLLTPEEVADAVADLFAEARTGVILELDGERRIEHP